jgi:hypothetical protein
MRSRLFVLVLPALLALVLVVTGCGGGGGGSESSTVARKPKVEQKEQLSKASFIRQGDEICAEVNTAIGSAGEAETEAAAQTTQIANLYIGMVGSLQDLGRPSETTGYSEFMGAAEELAMVENEVKKAGEAEDLVALEEASQSAVPAVEGFQSEAAVYGFEDCSEAPHAPEAAPETGGVEGEPESVEEPGGVEVAPEEEFVPEEEEFIPEEEEVAPEEEEFVPETGGAGGGIEEVEPEEVAPEAGGEAGGIGPG